MSRPLRGNPSDAATIHALKSDTEGVEVNAGDLSLPNRAGAFTVAATVEAWLEAMQLQINTLTGTPPLTVPQLAGIWRGTDSQQERSTQPTWFVPDIVSFIKV